VAVRVSCISIRVGVGVAIGIGIVFFDGCFNPHSSAFFKNSMPIPIPTPTFEGEYFGVAYGAGRKIPVIWPVLTILLQER
jgi:hypothetical protein